MTKPRVFVVHEPTKYDAGSGEWQRTKDVSSAAEFGEIVFLIPPGSPPTDPEASLTILRRKLVDYTADDYLMPIGNPALIAWAAAIAVNVTGGPLRLLIWRHGRYAPAPLANVLGKPPRPASLAEVAPSAT